MLMDHIGQVFFQNSIIFVIIGRLAFPLFAWELAKGFKRTKCFKAYIIRILILAILSQPLYSLLFNNGYFNICFTLFISLIILKMITSDVHYIKKLLVIVALIYFAYGLNIEYGLYGVAIALSFYFIENIMLLGITQIIITIYSIVFMNYYPIQLFSILAIILIAFLKKYDFKCSI
jgi:hypothetical protein